MNNTIARRLEALGIELPILPEPRFSYVPGKVVDGLVFVSGQTPTVDGRTVISGRCGDDVDVERAQEAARLTCINLLAELEYVVGLENVEQIVKLNGYVALRKFTGRLG